MADETGRRNGGGVNRGYRRDGFTPEKKRRFLKAYGKYGNIADACRAARISGTTFYRHERKDPAFRALCEAALAKASQPIEALAWQRGVTGIEEEVIHYGKVVGTRIRRSDSIFRMILIASNPRKYGRMGAVQRTAIERELRPAIEAELRAKLRRRPLEEVHESILRKLAAIERHRAEGEGEGE